MDLPTIYSIKLNLIAVVLGDRERGYRVLPVPGTEASAEVCRGAPAELCPLQAKEEVQEPYSERLQELCHVWPYKALTSPSNEAVIGSSGIVIISELQSL